MGKTFLHDSIYGCGLCKTNGDAFYNLKRDVHSLIAFVLKWEYRKLISVILMLNVVKCICLLGSSLGTCEEIRVVGNFTL